MLYKFKCFIFCFLSIAAFFGCEERENYDKDLNPVLTTISSLEGNGTRANIDHLRGTINLVLPPRTDITNVELVIDAPEGVEVSPSSGTTLDLSDRVDVSAIFANSVRNYQLITRVLPSKIAFLGEAATFEELIETADDDVAEAARWVQETYAEDFEYLNAEDVTYEQLQEINVVVFYYDQVGSSDLPEIFTEGRPKSAFIQYLVEGGKMLLGGMATSFAETVGRDQSGLLTIQSNGEAFDSPDTWAIDGGVNFMNSKKSHPIYTFNEGLVEEDENGYFPIIDAGLREDHNNLWDASSLLGPGNQQGQFGEFERLYNGVVLAVWSGVADECCPGIIEFEPMTPYSGTIIAIGVGGIEWNMNDGRTNAYRGNVEGIYKNAIDYLGTL
ncbi:DUF4960 domain-containing protein [Salegentibacter sp. Hel_I_6]|uniref:DUF4960 domain-containing protein n=1 Tax=Salegentibacter sp. Hel_I_6 TaxID=1250278 RepID=UPI00056C4D1E|nr:DUF4960 domain-containing protein [Salegentibacter sp. Hel_I_6]